MSMVMELGIKTKLGLIIFAISLPTLGLGISDVSAIFPFDEFMTPTTNETVNQSSRDPFTDELTGEHGDSPDGED